MAGRTPPTKTPEDADRAEDLLLLEPWMGGSRGRWAEEYAARSTLRVGIEGLPPRHWKWRMHASAVTFARRLAGRPRPRRILASSMIDVAVLRSLLSPDWAGVPLDRYVHESQLLYPASAGDPGSPGERDRHYAFVEFTSALAADHNYFASVWHRRTWLEALPAFLRAFPPPRPMREIDELATSTGVLPLGLDLAALDRIPREPAPAPGEGPILLWNHRWEHDKGPEAFFEACFRLADEGLPFRLAVLGQAFGRLPPVFAEARSRLAGRILRWGEVPREEYPHWLRRAHILPVASRQDFFGAAVVEAAYAGCRPVLPDRLAYPEHLPEDCRYMLYPDGDEALPPALREAVRTWADYDPEPLRRHLLRYDWSVLAPCYDALFATHRPGERR